MDPHPRFLQGRPLACLLPSDRPALGHPTGRGPVMSRREVRHPARDRPQRPLLKIRPMRRLPSRSSHTTMSYTVSRNGTRLSRVSHIVCKKLTWKLRRRMRPPPARTCFLRSSPGRIDRDHLCQGCCQHRFRRGPPRRCQMRGLLSPGDPRLHGRKRLQSHGTMTSPPTSLCPAPTVRLPEPALPDPS